MADGVPRTIAAFVLLHAAMLYLLSWLFDAAFPSTEGLLITSRSNSLKMSIKSSTKSIAIGMACVNARIVAELS